MASVAKYGNYTHSDNECNLVRFDRRTKFSSRNRRIQTVHTAYLMGELLGTGSTLIAAAQALISGYALDYGSFTYTIDGTLHEELRNGLSVSGVRVMYRSWAKGDAAELATKRTYSIVLQAIFDEADDPIVYWQENLHYIGNCGPRFEIIDTYNGPFSHLTAISTPQRIIQYGYAVGYVTNPLPPGSLFPQNEHQDLREVVLTSGLQQGQGFRFFKTSWKYVHTLAIPQEVYPITL